MSTTNRDRTLDGVRGLAIVLVLIGHAFDNEVGALAAAGVTVFFGLSGYLITELLVAEYRRDGRIRLPRFYARRMTRLAPPLFVMLAVVCAISWPGWGPLLSASTWTANYTPLMGVPIDPLGHTWSLAVEEQFYLVWPLALGALLLRGRALQGALVITLVLLAWRTFCDTHGALLYGYGALETAGSAILAGAVVSLGEWRLRGRWAAVAVAGMLTVSMYAAVVRGSVWLAVPLLVTPFVVMLLAAARSTTWLAWPPLAVAGVTSYSMYLWHEPVSYLLGDTLTPAGVATGALVGLVAYVVVEAPVMRWRSRQAGSGLACCLPLIGRSDGTGRSGDIEADALSMPAHLQGQRHMSGSLVRRRDAGARRSVL